VQTERTRQLLHLREKKAPCECAGKDDRSTILWRLSGLGKSIKLTPPKSVNNNQSELTLLSYCEG